jgi:MFS family permease
MAARSPSPRAVLVGASVAQAALSFVGFGLPAIGPQLREHYGLGLAELGAALTASFLGAGVALIPAGVLVDRVGARLSVLGGTALSAAGLVAAAASPSGGLALRGAARVGCGIGGRAGRRRGLLMRA